MRVLIGFVLLASTPAWADAPKAPIVFVENAQVAELADVITYPARVSSRVQAAIYAPVEGVIASIDASLGKPVRAGERVLAIKNTDPVYEYVPIAVAAPVNGVVSSLDVSVGARVTKGQALASVIDPAQVRLVVEVPASDVAAIQPGLGGTFAAAVLGRDAKPLGVKISGISPLIDSATGTASAELAFDQNQKSIPLGTLGKVSFAINKRQGVQIPEQALVYRGKETFVRVVEAGKVKMTPVKIAETRSGRTEIASGLSKGAAVIVRSSGFVADGQEVVVQAADVVAK